MYCYSFLQKISLIFFVWLWPFFVNLSSQKRNSNSNNWKKKSDSRNSRSGDCVSVSSWVPLIASSLAKGSIRLFSSTPWEIIISESDPWLAKMLWCCQSIEKSWKFTTWQYQVLVLFMLQLFVEIKIFCNLCNVCLILY